MDESTSKAPLSFWESLDFRFAIVTLGMAHTLPFIPWLDRHAVGTMLKAALTGAFAASGNAKTYKAHVTRAIERKMSDRFSIRQQQ